MCHLVRQYGCRFADTDVSRSCRIRTSPSDCCHAGLIEYGHAMSSEARMNDATRRGFLGLVSAGAGALIPARQVLAAAENGPASNIDDSCILTPRSEEGPYYLDPKLVR